MAGLHIHSCFGIYPHVVVKVGVPAETKNVWAGELVKALYSLHAGDVDTGVGMNTGVVMAPANHDGAVKYCMAAG